MQCVIVYAWLKNRLIILNLFEIHQTFFISDNNHASYDIASKPLRLIDCSIAAILHLYYTTKPHTYTFTASELELKLGIDIHIHV